ncbi:alpha-galactosidase [Kouleothrix aurantiaca]|uniref:Alpha-galactosidase n=1 Tax=Kouleothrix aurantiaca TaxID=186479 RepID=A0A0P9DPM0_9CHLR|nr:alpha-galactosidase [Kouleothrix aurantiaca]
MPKITFIGAGSVVFTRNLCSDILLTPALQESTISLMDLHPERLAQARDVVQALIDQRGLKARVEASTNLAEAVRGADYVVTTFQQGGLDAYQLDIDIPQRYGVEQCVGDTLGPGGVFRSLRTIPVLLELGKTMDALAPNALLLNYVNPMAANCWAFDRATGRPHVGLCHSVQGTSEMLARWIKAPYEDVVFRCAGINHQAFFLEFRQGAEDLYPRIREAAKDDAIYGSEPVRIDLMKYFGYFVTESSGHASEYSPYFRKTAQMVNGELVPRFTDPADHWFDNGRTGGYLRHCLERLEHAQADFAALASGEKALPTVRTHEYGSRIIEACETNQPARINGNVPNRGLIPNLPTGCCVEVPVLVDKSGLQPTKIGALPPQLAALMQTNVNVQSLVVEAALTGKREHIYHAAMLDPHTGAELDLDQIHSLVDDLIAGHEGWLPAYQ